MENTQDLFSSAARCSKPCLKSDLPSPAGVEMAVVADLTGAAAIEGLSDIQLKYILRSIDLSLLGCTAQQS